MCYEPHCKHQLPALYWQVELLLLFQDGTRKERGMQSQICKPWMPDLNALAQIARE